MKIWHVASLYPLCDGLASAAWDTGLVLCTLSVRRCKSMVDRGHL